MAGGLILVERYLFRIGVPLDGPLPFVFDDIVGFELIETTGFDAVLGIDVFSRCDFEMLHDGTCRLRLV